MLKIRPPRRRGFVIVSIMIVLFMVMAIMLIGMTAGGAGGRSGLMSSTNSALNLSGRRAQAITAFNLAESGVEYTLQWLHMNSTPPSNITQFAPALWGGTTSGMWTRLDFSGFGSVRVSVSPDVNNAGNSTKRYLVESVATSGGATQIVRAVVQQANFGRYAYFTDNHRAGVNFVSNRTVFDGPAHTNNRDGVLSIVSWLSTAGTDTIFKDMFTASGAGIVYKKNGSTTGGTPVSEADWLKIADMGSPAVRTREPMVPMPTSSNLQLLAALPAGFTPPASMGVLVPASGSATAGGIYVKGAVEQMRLSVDGSGNQVITITQAPAAGQVKTTTIVLNKATNQTRQTVVTATTVSGNTTTTTTNSTTTGLPNGVIYCDSDVGAVGNSTTAGKGLSGVVADGVGLTIATDITHNVYLNGDITYQTRRQQDPVTGKYAALSADPNFVANAGRLGIVTNQCRIVERRADNTALNNIEMDAAVLAYDTFDVVNYAGRPAGVSDLMGSYIAGTQGTFGQFNSTTSQQTSGLEPNRAYDPRLADNPPPYFPTTGTQYDIVSWQRVGSTIQ